MNRLKRPLVVKLVYCWKRHRAVKKTTENRQLRRKKAGDTNGETDPKTRTTKQNKQKQVTVPHPSRKSSERADKDGNNQLLYTRVLCGCRPATIM